MLVTLRASAMAGLLLSGFAGCSQTPVDVQRARFAERLAEGRLSVESALAYIKGNPDTLHGASAGLAYANGQLDVGNALVAVGQPPPDANSLNTLVSYPERLGNADFVHAYRLIKQKCNCRPTKRAFLHTLAGLSHVEAMREVLEDLSPPDRRHVLNVNYQGETGLGPLDFATDPAMKALLLEYGGVPRSEDQVRTDRQRYAQQLRDEACDASFECRMAQMNRRHREYAESEGRLDEYLAEERQRKQEAQDSRARHEREMADQFQEFGNRLRREASDPNMGLPTLETGSMPRVVRGRAELDPSDTPLLAARENTETGGGVSGAAISGSRPASGAHSEEADAAARKSEDEAARRREDRERGERAARERADQERAARTAAEKAAAEKAAAEYLASMRQGIRLRATKCPDGQGHYYVIGDKPSGPGRCIDVTYQARCPSSVAHSTGVAGNFVGISDCFGDTYQIQPKPSCDVRDVVVSVVDVKYGCK